MNCDAIIDQLPKLTSEDRERIGRYLEHLRRFDDPKFIEQLAGRIDAGSGLTDEQIVRDGSGNVVLLAADEFAAMEETLHLFSTPANTERIRKGLDDYAAGRLLDGELCD